MTPPDDDDDRTQITPRSTPSPATPAAAPAPPFAPAASADAGNALPVGTYLGEFELTGVIGEGGFGIVYNAWDHSLQRRVALKEYMPASLAARERTQVQVRSARHAETFQAGLKSFVNEARLLAQFDHPSLVKVYRFWEAHGTAYMVMPLYQGTTLRDRLRAMGKPPDEAWLMTLLAPLTEALAVIHGERCFHRDIAPDNVILLEGSERPLLLDFGAARRVIGDMTQALTVILKPGYAPVEQYAETPDMKQGAWTDIYALAASVHFALVGRTPPPSVSRLMSDSYQPLADRLADRYSANFLRAIDHALKVRPEDRFQSIAELRDAMGLDAWAASQPQTRMRTVTPTHLPPVRTEPGEAARPAPAAPPAAGPGSGAAPGFAPTAQVPRPVGNDEPTLMNPGTAATAFPPTYRVEPAAETSRAAVAARPPSKTPLWAGLGVVAVVAAGGAFVMFGSGSPPAPEPNVTAAAPPSAGTVAPPAVTTPPAPAPAPAPVPFNPRAAFDAVSGAQTPGWDVVGSAVKPVLRIGRDALAFDVRSSRDGYAHVLLLGPDGNLTLLFPNDAAKDHRIRAGQTLRLPQASWALNASEPAGMEYFLVVVSPTPRDFSELATGKLYGFQQLATGDAATAIAARTGAAQPLLAGRPTGCDALPDCAQYGASQFAIEVAR